MDGFVISYILLICTCLLMYSNGVKNKNGKYENIKSYQGASDHYRGIGILQVKIGNTECVTGTILIADGVALANANDVSKIDKHIMRESAKATFFISNTPRNCKISNYIVHPEFEIITLNTIALVYLDCDHDFPDELINWPLLKNYQKDIILVGFTDQNKIIEQFTYQMSPVDIETCKEFYRSEKIDYYKLIDLWPHNVLCAKAIGPPDKCIFDAGMVLVSNNTKSPTLIGLSTYGPGCTLPSRYIEIFSYIAWIRSNIESLKAKTREIQTRRNDLTIADSDVKPIDTRSNIVSDSHYVVDDFYITKLNDTTMIMETANANIREAVHGDCLNNHGVMMYREAGLIRARGRGTGVFALSLYDLFYNKITCVMVSVNCIKRSLTKFWYEKGFRKYDFSDIIKIVPHPKRGEPVPPKILFLTDSYHKYDEIITANILFKFEFKNEATINVDFYGTPVITKPKKTS